MLVERLLKGRAAQEDELAEGMERALMGPPKVTLRPVDTSGVEHWVDEVLASLEFGPRTILLRATDFSASDTYTAEAVRVYVRDEFAMKVGIDPVAITRGAAVLWTVTLTAESDLQFRAYRAMFT